MANNRLYLYCKGCGKAKTLAKCLANGWYTSPSIATLDDFFERHNSCHEKSMFSENFYGLIEETHPFVKGLQRDEKGDLIISP